VSAEGMGDVRRESGLRPYRLVRSSMTWSDMTRTHISAHCAGRGYIPAQSLRLMFSEVTAFSSLIKVDQDGNEIKQHRPYKINAAALRSTAPSTVHSKEFAWSCTPIPKPGWPCPRECGCYRFPSISIAVLQTGLPITTMRALPLYLDERARLNSMIWATTKAMILRQPTRFLTGWAYGRRGILTLCSIWRNAPRARFRRCRAGRPRWAGHASPEVCEHTAAAIRTQFEFLPISTGRDICPSRRAGPELRELGLAPSRCIRPGNNYRTGHASCHLIKKAIIMTIGPLHCRVNHWWGHFSSSFILSLVVGVVLSVFDIDPEKPAWVRLRDGGKHLPCQR